MNKITCHLVSAELANGGFFVDNANTVNITHWKSQILPHRRLQWKRRGFKFCLWVSCICSCHCCKSGVAPFRNRAVRQVWVRKVRVGKREWGSMRLCGQWMNGRGRRRERSSRSSKRNKVYNIVCSLAVNEGDDSSRYSKAPWYYFRTSLTCESVHHEGKHKLRPWRKSSLCFLTTVQVPNRNGVTPCYRLAGLASSQLRGGWLTALQHVCVFPLGKVTGSDIGAWQHQRFHFLIWSLRLWLNLGWFRFKIKIVTPLYLTQPTSSDLCSFKRRYRESGNTEWRQENWDRSIWHDVTDLNSMCGSASSPNQLITREVCVGSELNRSSFRLVQVTYHVQIMLCGVWYVKHIQDVSILPSYLFDAMNQPVE